MNNSKKINLFMPQRRIIGISLIYFYFFNYNFTFAQEMTSDFFDYKYNSIIYDSNLNDWNNKTSFGPLRYQDSNFKFETEELGDSFKLYRTYGLNLNLYNYNLYAFQHISYKSKFYSFLYFRIVNEDDNHPRYTGIARNKSRAGFNSGETDFAGFGYQDEIFLLQFGRGRQSWGVGNDIKIVLNENSPSYDYGLFGLKFGNYRFRYFHGFLENIDLNNRYINGRGVEWNNYNNLLLSISEIVIYSGLDRPMDFSYMNPVSSHLEVEFNNRQNKLGVDSGNAVWQLAIDYKLKSNIRIMSNFIIDELVLDKIQLDSNKTNGLAFSSKIIWCPLFIPENSNIFMSYIYVGTKTFRHEIGYNNFVQRGAPLGWAHGSDGYEFNLGSDIIFNEKILMQMKLGKRSNGENSILDLSYSPNEDYLRGPFPSGQKDNIHFLFYRIDWKINKNLFIFTSIDYSSSSKTNNNSKINVGINLSKN